ncbi:Tryptophan--tRNA ligase [Pseudolycoriella hygida]|uniref:tryptophan--tRNA ligase n=1 Tax=Pseudolycoriella hygida TaxID=35572 RepID=A0A9Q0N7T0_9DIPT|nr:Tryptophan--tRNA ligase [Pseudolycoriella hygida]
MNYPVSQAADILIFRPQVVPVGIDQVPHLELTRNIARKLNNEFFNVPSDTPDHMHVEAGGLFPIVLPLVGRVEKLIGINKPNREGVFPKMSKSLENAIFLSDSSDIVSKKIKKLYTDPKSNFASKENPVSLENNPLWIYHKIFNHDKEWVKEASEKYIYGNISNLECKEKLIEVINELLQPIRERRLYFEKNPQEVIDILKSGTKRANEVAEETLSYIQTYMGMNYFNASLD